MPQSIIKQLEDMDIREYRDEDIIFTDRNWRTLEAYNDNVNAPEVTAGVYNNYNNNYYNHKEDGATHENGSGANATHEDCTIYTKNPT